MLKEPSAASTQSSCPTDWFYMNEYPRSNKRREFVANVYRENGTKGAISNNNNWICLNMISSANMHQNGIYMNTYI